MRKFAWLTRLIAALFVLQLCGVSSSLAVAGERSYLSRTGSDANPCSAAAPCLTLIKAIATAGVDGEVYCLDGSFFGSFAITFSVSIMCEGKVAQLGATLNSITLPANGVVILNGIEIDQRNFGGNSITFNGAGTLHLQNATIRGSTNGVRFVPTGPAKLVVDNVTLEKSTNTGLLIQPGGAGSAQVVIDGLNAIGNSGGVYVAAASAGNPVRVEIRNSVLSGNSNFGLASRSVGGGLSSVTIDNSSVSNNASTGIVSRGSNSRVLVGRSTITGNNTGLSFVEGGALLSYGNNAISNVAPGTGPSGAIGLQ